MNTEREVITPLIRKAFRITSSTDQKVICKLLSEVSDAETWKLPRNSKLSRLHSALSRAYSGRVSDKKGWDSELKSELNSINDLI